MKIDSIIFDLDGTLWSTIEAISGVWKEILDKHIEVKRREVTSQDMKGCMGYNINEIGNMLFPEETKELQDQLMKECCENEQEYLGNHGGKLYDKVEETLKKLSKKYKLFIVSNCQDGYIQCFFKAHKLDKYITDIECSGKTGLSKGENNKRIINRNNLKNAVYVGDTIKDQESAMVANIPFVYARYGFGEVEKYDYVIDNFHELLNMFD